MLWSLDKQPCWSVDYEFLNTDNKYRNSQVWTQFSHKQGEIESITRVIHGFEQVTAYV